MSATPSWLGGEAPLDQIGRWTRIPVPHHGPEPLAPADAGQGRLSHQPGHALAAHMDAFVGQLRVMRGMP